MPRRPLVAGPSRRGGVAAVVAVTAAAAASLFGATTGARAVVVDMNAIGQSSVTYNPADQSGYYGVALVPGLSGGVVIPGNKTGQLTNAGVPTVTSNAPCTDPALTPDLILPNSGLCSHGGAVIHQNETFTFTWDPLRRYWATTRNYVQRFLSDVAVGSGTLTSPYADVTQYTDSSGRAANVSAFGGGCIDYGDPGGYTCQLGNVNGTGNGDNYPAGHGSCASHVSGNDQWYQDSTGAFGDPAPDPNDVCLTDADIRSELSTMIIQSGMLGRAKPGHTPLVVLLTPPGVETCLDSGGKLCSANSAAPARFCSYHGQLSVAGTEVSYVVQPWTASLTSPLGCDDPSIPAITLPAPADQLANDVGQRLVSPLSQSQLAALVNPNLSGWFGLDGAEINDNGCIPLGSSLDSVTVGNGSYFLQREFNNAGAIESDPNALACTPWVWLLPSFVVPSAVNPGDVVEFDGSTTASTLIVPKDSYRWDFGDGTGATGPSVTHAYAKGGAYNVELTVTDRGGNVRTLTQTIDVLGPSGLPAPPTNPPTTAPPGSGAPATAPPSSGANPPPLRVRMQLMPESLRSVVRSGLVVRVSANLPANGIAYVSIPRGTARRLHIKAGRGPSVVIGRGTVSAIKSGTVLLRFTLSAGIAAKLRRLRHVDLTVRLALIAPPHHLSVVVAGRY